MVLPEGERAATLHIRDGVIEQILEFSAEDPTGARIFNVPDLAVSPGIVDTHVHVNEPGRSDWEGFDTATRAAAAGGVTTLIDMPLNSVPATTTVGALYVKVEAARAQCHVDVGFWGGVVPGNAREIEALIDAGVRGFKCFLVPSGVDEFPAVNEQDLRLALPILARRGVPLLVHAELIPDCGLQSADSDRQYAGYLATRPASMER
ncbi:MAG TPA: amidohydrolase family protein, partial [Vicinamibacterales bacterium]|nr:amidohydrolase family protein [Vicinamibacterales bacterium]